MGCISLVSSGMRQGRMEMIRIIGIKKAIVPKKQVEN